MGSLAFSIPLLLAFAALGGAPQVQGPMPMMNSVEPASGRVGDTLAIRGENLGSDNVAALYLTDGKVDIKVAIVEQTARTLRFKIPPEAKPGRLALMVLTREAAPRLIEQPVKITVESDTSN
jgi:hypothetical protein